MRPFALSAVLILLAATSSLAQRPALSASPEHPEPGALVQLTLRGAGGPDSVREILGTMDGEPLHFEPAASGDWHAIGPVSVDAKDAVATHVIVRRVSGAADTLSLSESLPPERPLPPAEPLAVDRQFTQPLSKATQARIDCENEKAHAVGRRAHDSPPLWTQPFLKPRIAKITSPFGSGRMFNGKLIARHLGVDFSAPTGTQVRAANRGVVALVDTFFLAGRVVYIDHGGGVVTGYFHLSKPLVAVGDTVERGQVIALSGGTGRVTGPHLHWAARYGALTVNPLDLLSIDPAWYSASSRR